VEITYKTQCEGRFTWCMPVFSGVGERRMNQFYNTLLQKAKQYAAGEEGRYTCTGTAVEEDEQVMVRIVLFLKRPGEMSRRRTLVHTWKRGWLISADVY